jgi:hypothetical protein
LRHVKRGRGTRRAPRFGSTELAQQDAAELFEAGGRVVERGDDRLAFVDLEGQYARLAVVCGLQLVGEVRVVDEPGELEDGVVADGDACEVDGHALLRSFGVSTGSAVGCGEPTPVVAA